MKAFKDALISNYGNYKPVIHVKIWNDSFDVHVNKFKSAGSSIQVTEAYDGRTFKFAYTHKPILVPDYKRMKLFWATCLVHNLDSQIVNRVSECLPSWNIPIHDALLVLPGYGLQARKSYAIELKRLNSNRNKILSDYRKSIGATTLKADLDFLKLYKLIQQAEDVAFNHTAMK
jgi:hypothetical protein